MKKRFKKNVWKFLSFIVLLSFLELLISCSEAQLEEANVTLDDLVKAGEDLVEANEKLKKVGDPVATMVLENGNSGNCLNSKTVDSTLICSDGDTPVRLGNTVDSNTFDTKGGILCEFKLIDSDKFSLFGPSDKISYKGANTAIELAQNVADVLNKNSKLPPKTSFTTKPHPVKDTVYLDFASQDTSLHGLQFDFFHASGSDHSVCQDASRRKRFYLNMIGGNPRGNFASARHVFVDGLAGDAEDRTINIDGEEIELASSGNRALTSEQVVNKIVAFINSSSFEGVVHTKTPYIAAKGQGTGLEFYDGCGKAEDGVDRNTVCLILYSVWRGKSFNDLKIPIYDLSYTKDE